jgi:hypothetical protein
MAHSYSPFPEGKLTDLAASAQETKVVISEKNEQSLKDLAFGSVRDLILPDLSFVSSCRPGLVAARCSLSY